MKKGSFEEQVLRTSKEIVVKFIETGRVSPTGFPDTFKLIYEAVHGTAKAHEAPAPKEDEAM
jgi:predicted transcriptional regulator